MFVRAFDPHTRQYYKSMVYALVDTGCFEQAVLYHPALDSFVLLRYLHTGNPVPQYEAIQSDRSGWVDSPADALPLRKAAPTRDGGTPLCRLCGYPEVVNDPDFLQALLRTGFVPREKTGIALRSPADRQNWQYIRTQADADSLMLRADGFHDATLERLFYKESYGVRQLTVRFDSHGWPGPMDLCFEGMLALHLEPAGENFSREIFEACLLVRDETVFWANADLKQEDMGRGHNYIKALNLKWRQLSRRPVRRPIRIRSNA